jgi:transposase
MAKFTRTCQTDLKYAEWELIKEYFAPHPSGRPRRWEMWHIVNAILYVTRTGCQWRMRPVDFAPWQTVYSYFWRWTCAGV